MLEEPLDVGPLTAELTLFPHLQYKNILPNENQKSKKSVLYQQLMLGSKIHIMHLITQDSCLIVHIPKNERCVTEIALNISV
jgi:hypothetical protein